MPLPESVREKLEHAKFHLHLLKAELDGYIGTNPSEIVPHSDSDPNSPTFRVRAKVPIPARLSLIYGDCLQSLRSALDYLVWELVLAANNQPTIRSMFPVSMTEKAFKEALRGKRLDGVSAEALDLITQFQPYTFSDPTAHTLAVLEEIVNTNKHRRILLATLNGFSLSGMLEEMGAWLNNGKPDLAPLAHGAKFGENLTTEQVNKEGDLIAFVALDEGAITGMEVVISAETFIGYTTDTLACFERFFV